MEVTIDKFGRVLIPKQVRKLLNIHDEQVLELTHDPHSRSLILSLGPDPGKVQIVMTEAGIPVIQNGEPLPEDFDTVEFIKATREEYLKRKMGLDE